VSLNQFKKLEKPVRMAIIQRMVARKYRFLNLMKNDVFVPSILLVGDRPAPDRPDDPDYHFTPFTAFHHSSLWVNLQLHTAGIDEARLTWINATDWQDKDIDHKILIKPWENIIALGNNARNWISKAPCEIDHVHTLHPQAWKRFHAKEPYPLISLINSSSWTHARDAELSTCGTITS
jgi:hypothetical protein